MNPKLLLPVFLLVSISCSAQFSFGIKAGVNISFFRNYNNTIYGNSLFSRIEENPKAGIMAGVIGAFKLSENISLQTELLYSQKGFKVIDNMQSPVINPGSNSGYDMTWHYLDMPFLLKAKACKNFFIEFGPSISFLLNAHFMMSKSPFGIDIPENQTRHYSKLDPGLNSGLIYSHHKFAIGARYSLGLTELKVRKPDFDPEIIYDGLPYGKHRGVQVCISYKIN